MAGFPKWMHSPRDSRQIPVLVYPRPGYPIPESARSDGFTILTNLKRTAAGGDRRPDTDRAGRKIPQRSCPAACGNISKNTGLMDIPQELTDEITALNSAIEQRPDDARLLIRRGKCATPNRTIRLRVERFPTREATLSGQLRKRTPTLRCCAKFSRSATSICTIRNRSSGRKHYLCVVSTQTRIL